MNETTKTNILLDVKNENLKKQGIRSTFITAGARIVSFIIQIGSTAVLARLLTPEEFGLVAMVAALINVAYLFNTAGLSQATVQKDVITHELISTLFWINVAISVVIFTILSLCSPLVSLFYNDDRLTAITIVLATSFPLTGLFIQHGSLLRRQLKFKAIAFRTVTSKILGASIAIFLAYLGYSYWALVAVVPLECFISLIITWMVCKWRPGLPVKKSGVRSMLSFGMELTGANILNYLRRNLDNVLVGLYCGPALLGIYSKAYTLLKLPFEQINAPVGQVFFPVLSKLQKDPERFRRTYLKAMSYMVFLGMPLVCFAFVAAEDLVLLLLGSQWKDVALFFRILAPAAFVDTFNVAMGWVLVPLGRSNRFLRTTLFRSVTTIIAFAVGIKWGAIGVAAAFSISQVLTRFPEIIYSYKNSPLRVSHILKVLWKPALNSILAAIILYEIIDQIKVSDNLLFGFIISALTYLGIYLFCWMLVPGGRSFLSDGIQNIFGSFSNRNLENRKGAFR